MIDVLLFVVLAGLLYAIRRFIQTRIQGLVLLMGGNVRMGIVIYSMLFLPGIIIHELSHFFLAAMLGVRTGDIGIFPAGKQKDDERVALGSVKVAKTDFVRGSIIGAAPFFVGCVALYSIVKIFFDPLLVTLNQFGVVGFLAMLVQMTSRWQTLLMMFMMFMIGNTMFSSKEDAKAFPILIVLGLIGVGLTLATDNEQVLSKIVSYVTQVAQALHVSFAFVLVLTLMVAGILMGIEKLMEKFTGKRVVYKGG